MMRCSAHEPDGRACGAATWIAGSSPAMTAEGWCVGKDVDGRNRSGHDEEEWGASSAKYSAHSRESGNPERNARPEKFALDPRFRGDERCVRRRDGHNRLPNGSFPLSPLE